MKKKLLTSAAIASFLTAAGVVIPQTDIFAADTPYAPHPSTLPGAQPSNAPSPSELTDTEKKEKIVTVSNPLDLNKAYEGGWGRHNINKKKVDSFVDYTLKDISLDNNKNLNIQTSSDDLSVGSVEYINEANGSKYELSVKKGTAKNSYLADTSKLTGGNYLLNNIFLSNSFKNNDFSDENIYTDSKEENGAISGDGPGISLSRKDLYKYDNKTKIKNLSETKLPELGDKDYLVYSDKTQLGGNDVLKVTVKYKKGLERFADKILKEYYSPNKPGTEAERITGKAVLVYHYKELPGKITISQKKDGEMIGGSGSFDVDMTLDSEGNDVFYIKNFKNTDPGHYYLRQLHDLDLTKGDLSNFEFDLNPSGKSVYRTAKDTSEPKEEIKPTATSPIVEKYIESLKGEITPEGKLVYTLKSKEPLTNNVSLQIFNDKTGDDDNGITLFKKDDKTFVGEYSKSDLKPGVYKPLRLDFSDSKNRYYTLKRQDLLSYDKQSQVFNEVSSEEPVGSPQLQGKKLGVFSNYKKVKRGTVVKYTLKTTDKEVRDANFILKHKEGNQFTQVLSETVHLYDSNGNRVVYVKTTGLEPGIYNVFGLEGVSNIKTADIYNEDGWFEVGDEDVRREEPAVTDTVPTTKPSETPKPDETPKPSETPKPGKEEILKPSETPKPGKEETLKPSETPKPGKEETLKPSETLKPGKEEMKKPERDNSWNPFAQGQKAKEGSTEVKSEGGEVATKPVSNRKEGKALPNTGLQTTSYGFLAAIVGLFGAVALRRKNR